MYAGVIALFLNGQMIDVDVIGEANDQPQCVEYSKKALAKLQPTIGKEFEVVIKCFPEDTLPDSEKAFMDAPIAAAGFGTKK